MQATSQTTQTNVQTEAQAAQAAVIAAKVELSALQLSLVGGGSTAVLFG